jgi:hypothetical protein
MGMRTSIWVALAGVGAGLWFSWSIGAQATPAGAPVITATAKGPNQINLAWGAVPAPFYGYLVEIRSPADSRYGNWTELQPIPTASGYSCDATVMYQNGTCNISDPTGAHVYNPPNNAVPYWVTDANYIDPQDNSPAQFIAWSLQPATSYDFRVRTYTGGATPSFGPYSNTVTATTAAYTLRYVMPSGSDSNDGTSADPRHAWHTIYHGSSTITCGQALIVLAGSYGSDGMTMQQNCQAGSKAVVMANPGDTVTITSMGTTNLYHPILLLGNRIVIDGIKIVSPTPAGDYDIEIDGSFNALLNVETHPPVIPGFKHGVVLQGQNSLVYRSSLHDYGSPDAVQNPFGNGGFAMTVFGSNATGNVIWSNHLTRAGHDTTLCKTGCSYNRWLNNVMDGGWGIGIETISDPTPSEHNLVEGNIIKDVGRLVTFYKPGMELSSAHNTARRNVVLGSATWGLEESAIGGNADHNLIYNNVFYAPAGCIFQSSSNGSPAYNDITYANNICYKLTNIATDIYSANTTNRIQNNTIVYADQNGNLMPGQSIIVWNHSGGSPWEYPKPLAYADQSYSPPFYGNKGLDVDPKFVNEKAFDFHLTPASPMINAGIIIYDVEWGTAQGGVDLGPYGIHLAPGMPGLIAVKPRPGK